MVISRLSFSAVIILIGCVLSLHVQAWAQDTTPLDVDAILQGFDTFPAFSDKTTAVAPKQRQKNEADIISLSGSLSQHLFYSPKKHVTAAGYRVHGLRSLKTRLNLTADAILSDRWFATINSWMFYDAAYSSRGKEQFSSEMVENYEKEWEIGESFIKGRISSSLDISFGRQVVIWGKADLFRVNDMWNPSDNREPGLVDSHFNRLPLLMTKADYFPGDWQVSAIITHEYRHDKEPVFGSDFYPYNFKIPPFEYVENNIENSSYGIAASRCYTGLDVGFYAGSFLQDYDLVGLTPEVPRRLVSRLKMAGTALEKAAGQWLFKAETAIIDGLSYYSVADKDKTRFDTLIGLEYAGFQHTRLSLEMVNRHLFDYPQHLAERDDTPAKNSFIWAIRAARSFLRDRLGVVFLCYSGGIDFKKGSAQKLTLRYSLSDSLLVTCGVLLLQSGDTYLTRNIAENDTVFAQLKFTF